MNLETENLYKQNLLAGLTDVGKLLRLWHSKVEIVKSIVILHYRKTGILIEKEELKTQLLQNIRSCLSYLLPNGTFCKNEFQVGDVWGNRGKSLRVELSGSKTGLWNDFATGDSGDIIDLWAVIHGKNARTEFSEVMASIGEWLGKQHTREKKSIKDLEQYMTCSWNYYDENNQVIVIVYRYDPPERRNIVHLMLKS